MKPAQRQTPRGQLEWRRRREADARYVHMVQPLGLHESIVRPQGSTGTKRVTNLFANITIKPGTLVPVVSHTGERPELLLGRAPLEGASAHARAPVFVQSGLSIVKAVPNTVLPGVPTAVRLTGTGFSEDPLDIFDTVVWGGRLVGWLPDPDATLTTVVWVDAENVDCTVTAGSDVKANYKINVQVLRAWEVDPP